MTTTALARRAEVAAAVTEHLFSKPLRDYLDAHPDVRDQDGDPVILALAADEGMEAVLTASDPHPHPVMLSTVLNGHIFVCVLGAAAHPDEPVSASAEVIDTTARTTVADLVEMLLPLEDGTEFVLTYSRSRASKDRRVLVGSR